MKKINKDTKVGLETVIIKARTLEVGKVYQTICIEPNQSCVIYVVDSGNLIVVDSDNCIKCQTVKSFNTDNYYSIVTFKMIYIMSLKDRQKLLNMFMEYKSINDAVKNRYAKRQAFIELAIYISKLYADNGLITKLMGLLQVAETLGVRNAYLSNDGASNDTLFNAELSRYSLYSINFTNNAINWKDTELGVHIGLANSIGYRGNIVKKCFYLKETVDISDISDEMIQAMTTKSGKLAPGWANICGDFQKRFIITQDLKYNLLDISEINDDKGIDESCFCTFVINVKKKVLGCFSYVNLDDNFEIKFTDRSYGVY